MFQGIKLSGFFRGHEAAQFEEEMGGGRRSLLSIIHEALREAARRVRATNQNYALHKEWVFADAISALGVRKPQHIGRPNGGDDKLSEHYWKAVNNASLPGFLAVLRSEFARRGHETHLKRRARQIGLAYWPALFCKGVDPTAFAIAEEVMAKRYGRRYGDRLQDGTKSRGGWDSEGFYGVSPYQVKKAWFASGCKDGRKFRIIVSALRGEGETGGVTLENVVAKRDSAQRALYAIRGKRWEVRNGFYGVFTKTALVALGRMSPWARWAAVSGLPREGARVHRNGLNWAEVSRLQKLPMWRRLEHSPARLQWQVAYGVDQPKGLEEVSPLGLPMAAYKGLCGQIGIDPFIGPDLHGGLRLPALNLARLFGSMGEIRRYATQMGVKLDALGIHDLGQFQLPAAVFTAKEWRRMVFKHPEVLEYASQWALIEDLAGGVPKTLNEVKQNASKLLYEGIENAGDMKVAEAAAAAKMGADEFLRYRDFMRTPRKLLETIPAPFVTGSDVGLEGDWRLRQLEAEDPVGPMLGLLTGCCQHLNGAARTSAIHGAKNPAGAFVVIEYRGNIVAQSWVWRADGEADSVVVFDSIEALASSYVEGIARLLKAAAEQMVGRLGVKGVRVGDTSYGITMEVKDVLEGCALTDSVRPGDDRLYLDGATQWAIPGVPS